MAMCDNLQLASSNMDYLSINNVMKAIKIDDNFFYTRKRFKHPKFHYVAEVFHVQIPLIPINIGKGYFMKHEKITMVGYLENIVISNFKHKINKVKQ